MRRPLLPLLAVVALSTSACTAIQGSQDPVTADDLHKRVCPAADDLAKFDSLSGVARRNFRDAVVLDCMGAIDRKYAQFRQRLQADAVVSNLATDFASLGLTAASGLTSGGTAKALAATGTAVIGAGAAVNKDVFYQQALPAVEASMDAKRITLEAQIVSAEKADPDATSYTLEVAGNDLDNLQADGDIYAAIAELNKTAGASSQDAQKKLSAAEREPYHVSALPADTYALEKKLTDFVWALQDPDDRKKLDDIANALGLKPPAGVAFDEEQVSVIDEIDKEVHTGDGAAQMADIQSKLKGLYP